MGDQLSVRVALLLVATFLLMGCHRGEAYPAPSDECSQQFTSVVDWADVEPLAGHGSVDSALLLDAIVPPVVDAGERFLSSCTSPDLPLSMQPDDLESFSRLARLLSPSSVMAYENYEDCRTVYTPTVKLINLDNDNRDEVVLHTQVLRCNSMGGLSIIYDFSDETGHWDGTLIWPSPNDIDIWLASGPHWVEPLVQRLDIQKASEESFFLVLGIRAGASFVEKVLTIWTWRDGSPTAVLEVRLDNWCGYPEWDMLDITEAGDILVRAAPAAGRCEAREAVVYTWDGAGFVSSKP